MRRFMGIVVGVIAGVLAAWGLLAVGMVGSFAIAGGLIVGAITASATHKPRGEKWLAVSFGASAGLWLFAQVVVENQAGPCNVDDLTGCSAFGEVAVIAWIVLMPTAVVLGLMAGLLYLNRWLRSDS